jgi:DnaJ-class molecular chaperone
MKDIIEFRVYRTCPACDGSGKYNDFFECEYCDSGLSKQTITLQELKDLLKEQK